MKTIPLNNGLEIPQIGVGTWTLRGETARQNVRLALEEGFRHIDTAQGYENEAEVGQGIADSSVPRGEIFVTTKVSFLSDCRCKYRKSFRYSKEKANLISKKD